MSTPLLALERQPNSIFQARREALAHELHGGVAVLFGNYEPQLEYQDYRQDEDFYYLTGWNEPGAALVVADATPARGGKPALPYREVLLLPERNLRMELFTGVKLDAASPNVSGVTGVREVRSIHDLPSILSERGLRTVWTQLDSEPAKAALTFAGSSMGSGEPVTPQDVGELTKTLRSFKDDGEIELLRKAANASIKAQESAILAIHPGVNERAISGVITGTLLANGCERPSYPSIVGSGINSTVLHYMADENTMQSGDVVVMDAAGEYSMYASDVTRTIPVNGHFTDRQREIYNIVLGAQRAAAEAFISGKSTLYNREHPEDSLDGVARAYIRTHGKDLHGQPLEKYFIHGLSHSVGIDVHDPLDLAKPLGPGSVFTIEPGIYLPEEKIGVRIEDTFYVDKNGKLQDFIADLPHTAEEIEALMQHGKPTASSTLATH
ncbi:MAG: aminopeptidase P N-terminal domain-containing protein [Acidobacteriaceae bacterium]